MQLEKKRILVTVKAYPNPSKKYRETVCCAGIDLTTNKLIRLYPIPFRDLDDEQKFKKYSVIEVACTKAGDDHRPESYKVDSNTIRVMDYWKTKNEWQKRKSVVLQTLSESMCAVYDEARANKKSLALIKPCEVSFEIQKTKSKNQKVRKECYAQITFFDKAKEAIELIPYDFYYHFKCSGPANCPGHKLPIIDWEMGQCYRRWRKMYPDEKTLLAKIEERWLNKMCSETKDTYFYVGNMKRFPKNFMVLGVFYPPKNLQRTLF